MAHLAASKPVPWSQIGLFFLISHGVTWLCWWPLALSNQPVAAMPWVLGLYAGGLGPTLAGLWLTWRSQGASAVAHLLRRTVDPRLSPWSWLLAALLIPPGLGLLAASIDVASGIPLSHILPSSGYFDIATVGAITSALMVILLFGPLPEEIGWRGWALDALQSRMTPLGASLILGLAWGLWHLPLFAMAGYHPQGAPPPGPFFLAIVMTTLLITWLYNHTQRSVLVAIMFHFTNNATGELLHLSDRAQWLRMLLTAGLAVAIVAWGRLAPADRIANNR